MLLGLYCFIRGRLRRGFFFGVVGAAIGRLLCLFLSSLPPHWGGIKELFRSAGKLHKNALNILFKMFNENFGFC